MGKNSAISKKTPAWIGLRTKTKKKSYNINYNFSFYTFNRKSCQLYLKNDSSWIIYVLKNKEKRLPSVGFEPTFCCKQTTSLPFDQNSSHFCLNFLIQKMFLATTFHSKLFLGKSSASFISKNDSCLNRFTY
jgi:hypothetical protein